MNLEGIYVMYENKNINDLNNVLLKELDKVIKWFSANKLVINLSKPNMLFSKLQVHVDNIYLEENQNETFLGVIIDNKLLWKNHIELVCSNK